MTSPAGLHTARFGVAVVAVTAAVISFTHVQHVARNAGETELTAWLLPLSIDGAIAAAAAVILADSKAQRRSGPITWTMLCLGLIASLAANIASAQPNWTARIVAAWPPIALALGIEVLAGTARRRRRANESNSRAATSKPQRAITPDPADKAEPQSGADPRRPSPDLHLVSQAEETEQPNRSRPEAAGQDSDLDETHPDRDERKTAQSTEVPVTDQEAIAIIRYLDQDAGGQASRRVIQHHLRCGASRARRLSEIAREGV